MVQDIDGDVWILILEFSDLTYFQWKCETLIIEFVQEWSVMVHTIRITTPMNWMDVGEDAVQEAQVVIDILHVQDGFPTFDELWGGDVR